MHERHKGGQRKDKKNERMRADVAERKANAHKEPHHTDQPNLRYRAGGVSNDAPQGPHKGDPPKNH